MELELRDSILWPLARPLGVIYEYLGHPLIEACAHTFLISTKPLRFPRLIRRGFKPKFLRKEIFTLANVATLYSFFLFPQLLYLMLGFFRGAEETTIYSLTGYFLSMRSPSIAAITWLIGEIFFIDLIDGPLARVNKSVTALGTLLDHTRDYITAFAALFFIAALTAVSRAWMILTAESLLLAGFALIMYEYIRIFRRSQADPDAYRIPTITRLKQYALEKYQTPLLGRVQFWTVGSVIISGLVSYAGFPLWRTVLFPLAIGVSVAVTYYYLFTLRRQNRELA